MCPICAAGISAWLVAGGAGGSAAVASVYMWLKPRAKKTPLCVQPGVKDPEDKQVKTLK